MSNDRMEKNVTIFASFFEKNNPRGKNPRGLKEQDRLYGLPEAVRVAFDFKVADLSLAEFGRKEIRLAEHEMPGLMATRAEFGPKKPLRGAKITGSLNLG